MWGGIEGSESLVLEFKFVGKMFRSREGGGSWKGYRE